MRAKFTCNAGITNVWNEPAVRGIERLKENNQCIHMNQKPLKLLEMILRDKNAWIFCYKKLCVKYVPHRRNRAAFAQAPPTARECRLPHPISRRRLPPALAGRSP